MNRSDFVTAVAAYLDGEQSNRWTPRLMLDIGGMVMTNEWSDLLNQNKAARWAMRSVITDAQGRVPFSALDKVAPPPPGTGTPPGDDTAEYFYRVIGGFTDGARVWAEVTADELPAPVLAGTVTPIAPCFVQTGDLFQLLPAIPGQLLSVAVSHTPPTIAQLASDLSTIQFPRGYEYILVWVTAATLLMKGGAESQAAADLFSLADGARKNMLGDIARRTTQPTFAAFSDAAGDWAG